MFSAMKNTLPHIDIPSKATYVKLAEDIDFVKLFVKIEQKFSTCFLFESLGDEGHMARHSIIGFEPDMLLRGNDNQLIIEDRLAKTEQAYTVENPYFALRDIVPQHALGKKYAGGLVGYLSYEAMNFFETSLSLTPHEKFDGFRFGVYTDGLVLDKMTGEVFYFYYTK